MHLIKLGMTCDEVVGVLGQPFDVSNNSRGILYRYEKGTIVLSFDTNKILRLVRGVPAELA